MARNLQTIINAPIIQIDTIDSTNNYAMRFTDADTAQAGLTIIAAQQTSGKGQRGKTWQDIPGQSILMSIIVVPAWTLSGQFLFSAAVATAISNVLLSIYENWDVRIKWPNDIIVNDKKAGGILIENVIRGDRWEYAIIGLGLNVLQEDFSTDLPFATSLKINSGQTFDVNDLAIKIRQEILEYLHAGLSNEQVITQYNNVLYRRDMSQAFSDGNEHQWIGTVKGVTANGLLEVQLADGSVAQYQHGRVEWTWK